MDSLDKKESGNLKKNEKEERFNTNLTTKCDSESEIVTQNSKNLNHSAENQRNCSEKNKFNVVLVNESIKINKNPKFPRSESEILKTSQNLNKKSSKSNFKIFGARQSNRVGNKKFYLKKNILRLGNTAKELSRSQIRKNRCRAFGVLLLIYLFLIFSPLIFLLIVIFIFPLKKIDCELKGALFSCLYGRIEISCEAFRKSIFNVGFGKLCFLTVFSILVSPFSILLVSVFYLIFLGLWVLGVIFFPLFLGFKILTCSCEKSFKSNN